MMSVEAHVRVRIAEQLGIRRWSCIHQHESIAAWLGGIGVLGTL